MLRVFETSWRVPEVTTLVSIASSVCNQMVSDVRRGVAEHTLKIRRILSRSDLQATTFSLSSLA